MRRPMLKRFTSTDRVPSATSTDAEFDALVVEANKLGFRELSRKLLLVWVEGAKRENANRSK